MTLTLAEEPVTPDEAALTADFIAFLQAASEKRHREQLEEGPRDARLPMRRFNQPRHTACVEAQFRVLDGLPEELRVGLFAVPRTFAARIRFANASSRTDTERDIRGMSVQVSGVDGPNVTRGASTQDFVLNSHPVMIAGGTRAFLELLRATEAGRLQAAWYFLSHPGALRIAQAARQRPSCHLDIPYWSTTPFLFGSGRAVKYIVRPAAQQRRSPRPSALTDSYLFDAMKAHLAQQAATFDFTVQFQTDGLLMPIEDATVEWKERDSPYRAVAQITIPPQTIDAPERMAFCEEVAFNPWHCLPEHRPLGSFNRARRDIYEAMAAFRRERSASSADAAVPGGAGGPAAASSGASATAAPPRAKTAGG